MGLTGSPGARGKNVSVADESVTGLKATLFVLFKTSQFFSLLAFRVNEAPLEPQDQVEYEGKW